MREMALEMAVSLQLWKKITLQKHMNTKHPLIDPAIIFTEEDTDINCDIEDERELCNIEMANG